MLAEVANIAWKKAALLSEISHSEAETIVAAIQELPLGFYFTTDLLANALKIALQTKRSVYDCLYLSLAQRERCQLMTDDRGLYDSLQSTSLSASVALIGDY